MNYTHLKPCAAWAEQLAATPRKDLTETERIMLDAHIASCPACAAVRSTYQQMDRDLVAMPPIQPRTIHAAQLAERENMPGFPVLATNKEPVSKAKQARSTGNYNQQLPISRRARFQHMLTTLAAVLVVCSIIGSALLLFSHHTSTNPAIANHTAPLPLYAALSNGTIYALQPGTGAILWRRQLNLDGQAVIGGLGVAHGVVYIGSFNGSLYALRASDGTLLWQRALGAVPNHPIAGDDKKVIYVGAGSTLYALRTGDGSILWQRISDSSTTGPYNTAVPVTVADGRVYGYNSRGLFALGVADGQVLWEKKSFNGVALVVASDKLFATVGTGEQIEVLRASDGQVLHMLSVQGNLGFDQGRLYVANPASQELLILRPDNENIITRVHMACPVTVSPDPLVVQNGLVYVYSNGQSSQQIRVCAMHVSNGKQAWHWTETRRIADVSSLEVASNHLYFLYSNSDFTQVELYALSTSNGARLWKYAFPSSFPYSGYFAI